MLRWALLLFVLLGCEPEPTLDAGVPDGPPMGRCPIRIIPSTACDLQRLTCPQDGLTCQCIAYEWRCFQGE